MRSKYEETSSNVATIESVVGKLIEELGEGGFMGVKDVQAGMHLALTAISDNAQKEYKGQVADKTENTILAEMFEGDIRPSKSVKYMLSVVVENEMYHWDNIQIQSAEGRKVQIVIEGNPRVVNRRKHPRLPLNKHCTVTIENSGAAIEGKMVNISAGGFAFASHDKALQESKGKDVTLKIQNFELESASELRGCIIRVTNNQGQYIVGCRMFEEREDILNYVKARYSR